MKRRLTKLVVFLLLGAVVNVAVAWGAGVSNDLYTALTTRGQTVNDERLGWLEARNDGTASTRLTSWHIPLIDDPTLPAAPEVMPYWSKMQPPYQDWRIMAHGWPLRTLWYDMNALWKKAPGSIAGGGFRMPVLWYHHRFSKPALPLRPIWPGFAINTIFYAVVLWLLTLAPLTARRLIRRKRGACIRCGYDLRGDFSAGCPECGWQRTSET
ncbi:MAG: hypothetical protein V3T53_05190 [Phycisphaerales bacterium]